MKLFRSLAGLLGRERDPIADPTLGMSQDDIDELTDFAADSRSWERYLRLLDNTCILYGEALLGTRDDASVHEIRGTILGLRKAARIVDETLQRAKQLKDADSRRRDNADAERRTESAVHFGSPTWQRNV